MISIPSLLVQMEAISHALKHKLLLEVRHTLKQMHMLTLVEIVFLNSIDRVHKSVSWLMLWTKSTTKDYIRAEHNLHSIPKLFISQVIIPQAFFLSLFIFRGHSVREPASSRVTCLLCGPTQEPRVSHSQYRENRERFLKKCKWMDRKSRNKQGRNPWQ